MSVADQSPVRIRSLWRQRSQAFDTLVAAVAFGLTLGMLAHGAGATRTLDALGVGLAAIACLPLVAHRRWPLAVFTVCAAASAIVEGLGYAPAPPLGPAVALFYVALDARTPERLRQTASTVVALGLVHSGAAALAHTGFPTASILGAIIVWGGAWIVGDQLRQRRQRLLDARVHADRAQRETARERRLAVADERNRIARDLHDSVAHAINVILVQAGGARLLQERDPGAVTTALSTIEDVARETIEEIDQLIHGLRTADEDNAAPAVEPPTGLASLPNLVQLHHAAGVELEMQVEGSPRPLAPGPDQAAYRILQESLTNAARHGSGPVTVRIAYGQRQLELTISNATTTGAGREATSAGRDGASAGYGILGMRERAALLGGSLDVGVREGSFEVTACLPYAAAARVR